MSIGTGLLSGVGGEGNGAEVKNEWSYTSASLYLHLYVCILRYDTVNDVIAGRCRIYDYIFMPSFYSVVNCVSRQIGSCCMLLCCYMLLSAYGLRFIGRAVG